MNKQNFNKVIKEADKHIGRININLLYLNIIKIYKNDKIIILFCNLF